MRGKLMTGGALASDLFPYSLASYLTCTGGVGMAIIFQIIQKNPLSTSIYFSSLFIEHRTYV